MSNRIWFLGRIRRLSFSPETYEGIGKYLGMSREAIGAALSKEAPDIRVFGAVLWAGLVLEDPALTPAAVIDELGQKSGWMRRRVYRALFRALREFSGQLTATTERVLRIGAEAKQIDSALGALKAAGRAKPKARIPSGRRR